MGTKTFANLRTSIARLGHWTITDTDSASYAAATAAAEAGLAAVDNVAGWPYAEVQATYTLADDLTSSYKLALPARLLHLQTKSFHYGTTRSSYLGWRDLGWIDAQLGPNWRQSSGADGTPRYICRVGNSFWIAPKPSSTFQSDYPYLYYGYFRMEDADDATLLMPNTWFNYAVHGGLAEGLKGKDDSDQQYYENLFENVDKPKMLGANLHLDENDQMEGSALAEELNGDFSDEQGYY
jgi:hypothetical protein